MGRLCKNQKHMRNVFFYCVHKQVAVALFLDLNGPTLCTKKFTLCAERHRMTARFSEDGLLRDGGPSLRPQGLVAAMLLTPVSRQNCFDWPVINRKRYPRCEVLGRRPYLVIKTEATGCQKEARWYPVNLRNSLRWHLLQKDVEKKSWTDWFFFKVYLIRYRRNVKNSCKTHFFLP